jgi:hypothetical protein
MIPSHIFDFLRPIASLAFAGLCWIAQTATPDIPGIPPWVTALGLPVAMLVAVIYALISTNNALRASERGRLEDRDKYAEKLEKDAEKDADRDERLIRATYEQTAEFRRLAEKIEKRP